MGSGSQSLRLFYTLQVYIVKLYARDPTFPAGAARPYSNSVISARSAPRPGGEPVTARVSGEVRGARGAVWR